MYETPITKGDHWNVSDVSIDIGGSSLEEVHEEDIEAEDFSDVEYAPPTATGEWLTSTVLRANNLCHLCRSAPI